MKDHSISTDKARYDTYIVANYLDTDAVKTSTKFYKTTFPSDMIITKDDASTSDEQVEKLTRELNIHYRYCIGSFIYLLSTRVDLSFEVHKLAKFSSNLGKVHFKGLVNLLRYIMDNKNSGLKYYTVMNDAPLSDLLRQNSIMNESQLISFSDYIWKYFTDTGISTGAHFIFSQVGIIDHGTNVTEPVAQSSS